jgi:hypothetical protein
MVIRSRHYRRRYATFWETLGPAVSGRSSTPKQTVGHGSERVFRNASSRQPKSDPRVSKSMPPPPPELPPPELPPALGSPLETTRFTAEPGATLAPAAGLSVITFPAVTVLLDCCVTVPTTRPAPVIAVVASACVMPTTPGTGAGEVNVAVTNWSSFATTSHELDPAQGPLQPEKLDPAFADAVSLTAVPIA